MTKRQLGRVLAAGGIVAALAILSLDLLLPGREGGFGPSQQAALAFSILVLLIGLSLLPLGDDPA